jgi:hypothetical protein
MSAEGIHPVSSKEHMLKPTDIFVVASHEDKDGQRMVAQAAKKAHVSSERMLYSMMVQMYSEKSLIRIRAGNTLFTIAAFEGRVGYVHAYNGDTVPNYIENMHQFLESARKLGFDTLVARIHTPELVRILKAAARKMKNPAVKTKFDSEHNLFAVSTGEKRD